MLEILLIIGISRGFGRYAENHNLSTGLWKTIAVLSYIIGEIGGIVLYMSNETGDPFDNIGAFYGYALGGVILLVGGSFLAMMQAGKNKKDVTDSEILDEEF